MSDNHKEFADLHGITMTAQSVADRPDALGDSDWHKNADHFFITLLRLPSGFCSDRLPVVLWSGFYSNGSGHPMPWARENRKDLDHRTRIALDRAKNSRPNSLYAEEAREQVRAAYRKAAPIRIEDVLLSLQMDCSGWFEAFEDWAQDLGYDSDSIKAKGIFDACQDIARAMRRGLGADVFEKFQELEEV
jgi:hypothetical protein